MIKTRNYLIYGSLYFNIILWFPQFILLLLCEIIFVEQTDRLVVMQPFENKCVAKSLHARLHHGVEI